MTSLIRQGFVDEDRLLVCTVVLGQGRRLLTDETKATPKLAAAQDVQRNLAAPAGGG